MKTWASHRLIDRMIDQLEPRVFLSATLYEFPGGESAGDYSISGYDSPNEMFRSGNYIRTNLTSGYVTHYTGGEVRTGPSSYDFGHRSSYVTQKFPGLFVLSAENTDLSTFEVNGTFADAEYDGGQHDSAIISLGGEYTGFVYRHYAANAPSINQLVIVGNPHGTVQQTIVDAHLDYSQTLTGLEDDTELHYLLFAANDGAYISNEVMTAIGNTWVSLLKEGAAGHDSYSSSMNFGLAPLIAGAIGARAATGPGTIGGLVWNDLNHDGRIGASEPRLKGWTVFADLDSDGMLDSGEPSAVSDAKGQYSISGLSTRVKYSIVGVPQGDWVQTNAKRRYAILDGFARNDAYFGFSAPLPGTINGTVGPDTDRDGVMDGWGRMQGLRVYVDQNRNGQWDSTEASAWTDNYSRFCLSNVPAGNVYLSIEKTADTGPASSPVVVKLGSSQTVNSVVLLATDTRKGTLVGSVVKDANKNRFADSNEVRPPGRTVYIDLNNDGQLNASEPRTITDEDGNFRFEGVGLYKTYWLRDISTDDWVFDGTTFSIESAAEDSRQNVLEDLPGIRFNGRVFHDLDLDGDYDAGEELLAGRTVYGDLNYNGRLNPGEPTTVSDAQGNYSLVYIPQPGDPHSFHLWQIVPKGWKETIQESWAQYNRGTGPAGTVDLGSHERVPASFISGTVFLDKNFNNQREPGEPLLRHVVLFDDVNNDGVPNDGERSTTSDRRGNFVLNNVARNGDETVSLSTDIHSDKYTWSRTYVSARQYLVGHGDVAIHENLPNTIAGVVYLNVRDYSRTSIVKHSALPGATVFIDLNRNGQFDPNEPSTVSDAYGAYSFSSLKPTDPNVWNGGYNLFVSRTDQYGQSAHPDLSNVDVSSSGITIIDINVDDIPSATVKGKVWWDKDGNHKIDAGEPSLAGRTIFNDENFDGRLSAGETSVVSNENGEYEIVVPIRSNYYYQTVIREANVPLGWYGGNYFYADRLVPDQILVINQPAELIRRGTISGSIWNDANRNGIHDPDEEPVASQQVFIDRDNDGVLSAGERSVLSDAQGHYEFQNVKPGDYHIATAGDSIWTAESNPWQQAFTLRNGGSVTGIDFLIHRLATVATGKITFNGYPPRAQRGIRVYIDSNKNGKLDNGEPSTVTDLNGEYSLDIHNQRREFTVVLDGIGKDQVADYYERTSKTLYRDDTCEFSQTLDAPRGFAKGIVFNDITDDGVQDAGEAPIAGRTVYADLNNDNQQNDYEPAAVSDAQGRFRINDLPTDRPITFRQILPEGFLASSPVSLGYANPWAPSLVHLGSLELAKTTFAGKVWTDVNANRLMDRGEPPVPGVTVFVDYNNNIRLDPGEPTAVTDAKGQYTLKNVTARGTVRQIVPDGYWQTAPRSTETGRLTRLLQLLATQYSVITGEIGK